MTCFNGETSYTVVSHIRLQLYQYIPRTKIEFIIEPKAKTTYYGFVVWIEPGVIL